MSIIDDYNAKIEEIKAVKDSDLLKNLNIPVAIYAQEAENLYNWSQQDKAELEKVGMDMTQLDDLQIRAGALRHAEAHWISQMSDKHDAAQQWAEKSPVVYKLRTELLQHFRFAYRNNSIVLSRVNAIAGGQSYANMFQDLHELSVLGNSNTKELEAIGFDMTLLERATTVADELSAIFAQKKSENDYSEAKIIRDKAYRFLKFAVDEIYKCGQYVNRKNEARKKGYSSAYLRRVRNRYKKNKENGAPEEESSSESI